MDIIVMHALEKSNKDFNHHKAQIEILSSTISIKKSIWHGYCYAEVASIVEASQQT
jgi:hypothetical protein